MLLLLLLAAVQDPAAMMAAARDLITAEHRCPEIRDSSDVTVCGLRRADRFRVPFIVHDPGDPRHEPVPLERERLLHRTNPVEDLSPFLVHGGIAGVSVGVSQSGTVVQRPLAP